MTSNPPTLSLSLADIERATKNYRASRDLLADRVQQLQDRVDQLRREAEPLIRSALQTTKAAESELSAAIACSPGLFKRPKSVVFHGVKVGFEKGKGKVTITDKAKTVALIRRHFDECQAELLIKVTETPIKKALQQLSVAECRRIGVEISEAGEQVIVRPVDSELDKALAALLRAPGESVSAEEDPDED